MINQPNALQSTTQKYLEIYDITNDVIILRDGTVSMVLLSSAINFDLYSEEEQDATIYAYAALLNSLSYPIEILIRSQRKDVTSYLDLLKQQEIREYNPTNKRNIREYREFVEQLVQERNVLEKKFYIVVSYSAIEAGIVSGSTFFPALAKKNAPVLDKHYVLEKAITNLEPRRDHLMHQFGRIGLSLFQLKTQDLIQLFYTIYNPESAKGVRVSSTQEYASPLVQASILPKEAVADTPLPTPPPPSTPSAVPVSPPPVSTLHTASPTTPSVSSSNAVSIPQTPVFTPELGTSTVPENAVPSAPTPPTFPSTSQVEIPTTSVDSSSSLPTEPTIKENSFTLRTDLTPPTPPQPAPVIPTPGTAPTL